MVSSYKGTENNEQPKRLILTANQTTTSYSKYYINGVFRNECAKIDYARRNGTLYRADGIYGELIDPCLILSSSSSFGLVKAKSFDAQNGWQVLGINGSNFNHGKLLS